MSTIRSTIEKAIICLESLEGAESFVEGATSPLEAARCLRAVLNVDAGELEHHTNDQLDMLRELVSVEAEE